MLAPSVKLAMSLLGADYEFERQLGVGGGGVVVLARHRPLDRQVAVKTITATADGDARARLRREGRALAALGHPSILGVYRLIEAEDALALVMEYLPGGDLAGALAEHSQPGSRIVTALTQVGSALEAAHRVGIVHRDVKPANVLLDTSDRTVLADFGLARLRTEFRTEEGMVTGTPLFMSPEQFLRPNAEHPSMDVYSFGIMTYRAVVGQFPFNASNVAELLLAHRDAPPIWPSDLSLDLPYDVCAVLVAALEKEPSNRARISEITDVLRRVDPGFWDELLPVSPPQPETVLPKFAMTGSITATAAPTHFDDEGDASGIDRPRTSSGDGPVPTAYVEPTIYVVPQTTPSRRPTLWIVSVLAGLAIGIAIGLLILVAM